MAMVIELHNVPSLAMKMRGVYMQGGYSVIMGEADSAIYSLAMITRPRLRLWLMYKSLGTGWGVGSWLGLEVRIRGWG